MSSNCPPQLHLSIQPSTTTFKRSFEQFGFDLDSPVGATDAGGSGTDNGNERNKRARSSSSFSQSSDSTDASRVTASTLASGSESNSSISRDEPSAITNEIQTVHSTARPTIDPPPRLPTPVIQDIDMAEVLPENDAESTGAPQQTPQQTEDRYRLSLDRFNAFENEIALLRRSQPLSPAITRSPTPPPMLPPLSIVSSSNQHLHQHQNTHNRPRAAHLSPTDLAFFRHPPPRSPSPFLDHFLGVAESSTSTLSDSPTGGEEISVHEHQGHQEGPSFPNAVYRFRRNSLPLSGSRHDQHQQRPQIDASESADNEIEMVNGFRDRLNTALERLRPASPLVPGLEGNGDGVGEEIAGREQDAQESQDEEADEIEGQDDEDDDERVTSANDRHTTQTLPPNPPTLPPIPPITADTDTDDWTERSLIDRFQGDFTQPDIRPPAASQNEFDAQRIRRIRAIREQRQIELRQRLQYPRSLSSSSTSGWPPPSSAGNPSLRDHPLPSPILRDLRSWMQERGPFGETSTGDATDASTSGHIDSSVTTSNSPINSHADQRQQSHVPNTQSISTSLRQSQSTTNSGGVSRVNEWDIYSRFPPQSAPGSSDLASAGGSSSSTSTSGTAQEPSGSNSFASASSSSSNSDMFSNTTSVSYSRNLADEAAVRSLDHGVGLGLGFGPGAARPMPPLMSSGPTPRRNDATDEQPRHTGSPTLTSTANGLGHTQTQRPITRFPSESWPSWARGNGTGPLPDLDLDFSSMTGTAGSALSSPSTSDDWRSDAFTAAPPGDRPLVRDSSPATTTTTISIDDSFLNPSMTSLDFFSATAAAGPGPAPANRPIANIHHIWTELPSSSTNDRQASFRSRVRRCPHNPQYVHGPSSHPHQMGAGTPTSSNPNTATTFSAERSQPETRRGPAMDNTDRHNQDVQYRRWLMEGEFGSDSDSLPLPNRIPSTSTPLLSRLNQFNPLSHRLASAASAEDASQVQNNMSSFPQPRLRTAHSHARLGSSTSLVSENASEMRRLEDYMEVTRARTLHALSTGLRAPGSEDRINADNTSTENSNNDERDRDIRRALAWDELRARQRQFVRHVSGGQQASNPETATATDTRSSLDRLVQNAWQSLESPDISLSSPEDEVPTWRARNLSAATSAPPAATTEDVDMSIADRIEAHDVYWTTVLRELGFDRPFDTENARPAEASQNRREGWESGYNPYSLSWSNTIPNLNSEGRTSGAATSTSPTVEGPSFASSRFPSFSSLIERSSLNPTREAMDANLERPLRRFPLTYNRVPSLPSPDLGGTFGAERPPQPTSPLAALRPEEPSRHFSGLSNRNSTLGNYAVNPSHYQNPTTATTFTVNNNQARSNVRPRQRRSLTPEPISRPLMASWDTMMDTSDDNFSESNLFSSLLDSTERLAQLTARHQAHFESLRRASNLADFAPGPFRNTLQHRIDQHNAHRRRVGLPPSNPPTIPPLSFGDNNLTSLSNSVPGSESRAAPEEADPSSTHGPFHTSRELSLPPRREPVRPVRPGASAGHDGFSHPITARSFASARAEANRARAQGETLRQMRMEASRPGDSSSQRTGPVSNGNLSLEEIDHMVRNRQILELSLRNRNRSRYTSNTDNSAPPTRPVYPGSVTLDDDDGFRESFSTFSARGRRNRLHSPHEMMFFARGGRRGRPLGDFMRDEDFDESYESLLSLAQTLGDVKPRSTPAEIIEKMEKAQYKDWATAESDQRCPICLDDYGPTDPVLKLTNCSHWLHQDCLHQWLQTANTCPVCRKSVSTNTGFRRGHHHHHRNPFGGPSSLRRDPPPPPPPPGSGPGPSQGGAGSNAGNNPPSSSSNQGHHRHHYNDFSPSPWRRGPPPV